MLLMEEKRGGCPDFLPSDIAGLQAWFRSDQISGLNDGDPVATWLDESGNSRDATAAGALRPTYRTSVANGLAIVRFDGSNDEMDFASPLSGTGALTICAVLEPDTNNAEPIVDPDGQDGTVTAGQLYVVTPEVAVRVSGNVVFDTALSLAAFSTLIVRNGSGETTADIEAFIDGVAIGQTSSTSTTIDIDNVGGRIGHSETFIAGDHYDGDLAELCIYNVEFTALNVSDWHAYAAGKWGIS